MLIKKMAGILMLILGVLIGLSVLLVNSGHTSSFFSTSDDVVAIVATVLLLAGGIYAVATSSLKK